MFDYYSKDDAFTAVKRDAKFYTRNVKGVPFVNKRNTKGVPFSLKMVYKRVRGWTSGGASPSKNLLSTPVGRYMVRDKSYPV